jgi:hypothetical protein
MDLLEKHQIYSPCALSPKAQPVIWFRAPVKPPVESIANLVGKKLALPKVRLDYSHAPSSFACPTGQEPLSPLANPFFLHTLPKSGQKHLPGLHSVDISGNAVPAGLGPQRLPKTVTPRKADDLHYMSGINLDERAVDHKPGRLVPEQAAPAAGNPDTSGILNACSLHRTEGKANQGLAITILSASMSGPQSHSHLARYVCQNSSPQKTKGIRKYRRVKISYPLNLPACQN